MTKSYYNPEHEALLKDFIGQAEVSHCVSSIVSARENLHELCIMGREIAYQEGYREGLELEFDRLLRDVSAGVDELHGLIQQSNLELPERPDSITAGKTDHWSLGIEEIRGPLMPFLRGKLEPVRRVVVAPDLPKGVVVLFLSIPGLRERLQREIHGHWGYHYHYLDAKERRSDTLLTFEQKHRTLPDGQLVKVLTWERHSEKSHFEARAASWGDKKRESVYKACIGDSAKRSLSDFKTPAKKAEALWPI